MTFVLLCSWFAKFVCFLLIKVRLQFFPLSYCSQGSHSKITGVACHSFLHWGWNTITDSMDMNHSRLQEIVKDREAWRAAVHGGHKESDTTEQLNWINWIKKKKVDTSIPIAYFGEGMIFLRNSKSNYYF